MQFDSYYLPNSPKFVNAGRLLDERIGVGRGGEKRVFESGWGTVYAEG